jgi:hypothetical protein
VDYINNLPEEARMVEITSNIWGTKFKIQGLHTSLPPLLGQVPVLWTPGQKGCPALV